MVMFPMEVSMRTWGFFSSLIVRSFVSNRVIIPKPRLPRFARNDKKRHSRSLRGETTKQSRFLQEFQFFYHKTGERRILFRRGAASALANSPPCGYSDTAPASPCL